MRILLLGGTRFIGAATTTRLAQLGHDVAVFHRGQSEAELPAGIEHIHGDRARLGEFAAELRRFAPEVLVDMLAMREADARSVIEVFRGLARRAVVISSADVYRAYGVLRGTEPGPPDPAPLTEDSPLRLNLHPYRSMAKTPGDWSYDYDKIPVERLFMSEPRLPGTVLRLPMVYGPRDGQRRLHPYLKRMDDGRTAILLTPQNARWRAPRGYVENVGAAIALAATDDRAAGRIYNIADAEAPTEAEWVRRIAAAAGWNGEIIPVDPSGLAIPTERLPAQLRPESNLEQDLALDATRIRRELGHRDLVGPEEAIAQTVAWERANVPEKVDQAAFDYAAEDEVLASMGRGG